VFLRLPDINNPGEYKIEFRVESSLDPYIYENLEIPISLLPELSVKTITKSVKDPILNEKLTFELTVENLGPAVARNIQVNYYDSEDRSIGHLIGQNTIVELKGNSETKLNFSWTPKTVGQYNITVHVDPENIISEVGNRYFNNLDKVTFIAKKKVEVKNGDEDGDSDPLELGFVLMIAVIVIVVILIIIFFLYHRSDNSMDEKEKKDEKTAKKIPLAEDKYGDEPPKRLGRLTRNKREKTARKIRMHDRKRKSGRSSYGSRSKRRRSGR
jgi:hypothetical protein